MPLASAVAPLLDEVCALVEWPAVYVGEFDREFLGQRARAVAHVLGHRGVETQTGLHGDHEHVEHVGQTAVDLGAASLPPIPDVRKQIVDHA